MATRATVQWVQFSAYRKWLAQERTFDLEVSAFAHHAELFADVAGFLDGQAEHWGDARTAEGKPLRLGECAFIPDGMFAPEGASVTERASATFTGRVTSATLLRNTSTAVDFWHVRVDTLPGQVDVVIDPALVQTDPVAGQIGLFTAWLVGRPTEAPPAPVSWMRRIFGG
jgi:hypothetical protein